MKIWDGYLGHLSEEEMQIFRYFYNGYHGEYRYSFDTKAEVKRTVKHFRECGWPEKVVEIAEYLMYTSQEKNQKAQESWERKMYLKLKRKYG